jgi:hypothetical protein
MCDLIVSGHGSFTLITVLTARGLAALRARLETKAFQWVRDETLVVETQYLAGIIEALAGFVEIKSKGGSGPLAVHSTGVKLDGERRRA